MGPMNEKENNACNQNWDALYEYQSLYSNTPGESKYLEPRMITRLLLPIPPPKHVLLAEQSVALEGVVSEREKSDPALGAIRLTKFI